MHEYSRPSSRIFERQDMSELNTSEMLLTMAFPLWSLFGWKKKGKESHWNKIFID